VIPREGVERPAPRSYGCLPAPRQVIPREGVESTPQASMIVWRVVCPAATSDPERGS